MGQVHRIIQSLETWRSMAVTVSKESDGKEYGRIITPGDSFVSPWSREKVLQGILNAGTPVYFP